jgi:hypothetical protein
MRLFQFPARARAIVVCLAGALLAASSPAGAEWVPPYKGNDTGGIIAYPLALTINVRETAAAHCTAHGKVPKLTGVQARYGGYVSFACVWPRRGTVSRAAY